jgi:hypothetical protein
VEIHLEANIIDSLKYLQLSLLVEYSDLIVHTTTSAIVISTPWKLSNIVFYIPLKIEIAITLQIKCCLCVYTSNCGGVEIHLEAIIIVSLKYLQLPLLVQYSDLIVHTSAIVISTPWKLSKIMCYIPLKIEITIT